MKRCRLDGLVFSYVLSLYLEYTNKDFINTFQIGIRFIVSQIHHIIYSRNMHNQLFSTIFFGLQTQLLYNWLILLVNINESKMFGI